MLGTQVSGKTLGLVGMGRIARAVARRAHHGFGMRVIFHDPYPPPPEEAAALGAEPRASWTRCWRRRTSCRSIARRRPRRGT